MMLERIKEPCISLSKVQFSKKGSIGPGIVAHNYNPSYSGGISEDHGLRPTWAKS
jgi:hypothetical protein